MFDLIGKTVGPYRILEQIGAGGMATVYKAYQPSMDRYIAVKVLPAHLSRDPDFTKRFQREARAISRLEHSHILPVHDYGEYEGITYIAMRYIKAGTLKDQMSIGGLSLEEINRLISQIGSALDYAHRMGVIHRDIKPANVLIDDQGDIYLSDFGLARMMEQSQQLTGSGVGLGTPAYMSPEQGQGNKIDHRTDIYALGIILYEMLTGRVPYEAETPMAVVLKHINGELPLPHTISPNTPESVERVVLKALAKDPDDRYQTAGEMVQALNVAIRMMSAEAQQPTVVDKVESKQQDVSIVTKIQRIWNRPRGRIMLASGTLAVIVLLGFLLLQLPGNITILASNAEQATPTESSMLISTSTAPSSDSTVVPTKIDTPTRLPSTPTPMLNSMTGHVIRSEHFDSLSTLSFGMYGVGTSEVIDGHLVLTEKFSSNPTADGEAAGRSTFSPQPGNVSVFLFKTEENTYFGYHFELYEQTASGDQYTGINLQKQGDALLLNFWKGNSGTSTLHYSYPVTKFQYGTWYYYSLQVQPDGLVTAQIWERDNPTNVIFNRTQQLDPDWAKPGFTFVVTSYQGTMEIDEYQEIELTVDAKPTPAPISMLARTIGRVIRSEHFDSLSTISFDMYRVGDDGNFDTLDGRLVLTDKFSTSGDPWGDGHVAGRSFFSPQVGNVSVFLFKAEENTYFGYHFELYENTADGQLLYRGINLDCCIPGLSLHTDRFLGDNRATPISIPVPQFRHGIWYFYALQVQPDGLVTAQIWERDQPANVILNSSFQLEEEWTKPGFTFVVAVDQGMMEVDEYQEVEPTEGATATP